MKNNVSSSARLSALLIAFIWLFGLYFFLVGVLTDGKGWSNGGMLLSVLVYILALYLLRREMFIFFYGVLALVNIFIICIFTILAVFVMLLGVLFKSDTEPKDILKHIKESVKDNVIDNIVADFKRIWEKNKFKPSLKEMKTLLIAFIKDDVEGSNDNEI